MADETIGVARIDLVVDGSGLEAELAKGKNRLSSFSVDGQRAYEGLAGAAKRATANFAKWIDGLDRTAESSKLANAAMAGVPLQILEEGRQRILDLRAANESAAAAAKELADAQAFKKQAADAQRLVQASEYVNWWKDALLQADAAQARMVEDQAFAQKAADAQKLVQATNYVRWWEDALQQADAQETKLSSDRAFIQSLENRANAAGKTASELLEMQAAQRGLTDQAAPFIAKLREQEGATRASGITFNEYGLSVKQTEAALRQVPSQITDIIVSLQGGQKPLTVLLQQGGQLRDIFGGFTPALRAMGGALIGMINPVTLSAAAIGVFIHAWHAGATEMDEFRKNAIMTGGALGVTADQASDMAAQMAKVGNITRSGAAAALTEVAKSGKIAGSQLQAVAQIAVESSELLGRSTHDVVSEFAKLSEDPVKGLKELNEQYHFLTPAIYEQVKALEDQGRTQDAARVAVKAYAEETQKRLNDVRSTLDPVAGAWTRVKVEAGKAWDAMFDVGRQKTTADMIRDIQGQIDKATALSDGGASDKRVLGGSWLDKSQGAVSARAQALKAQITELQAQQDALRQIAMDDAGGAAAKAAAAQAAQAQIELDDLKKKYLEEGRTRAQQQADEVASENRTFDKLTADLSTHSDEYEKIKAAHYERLRQIEKKYQEKAGADHTSFLAGLNADLVAQQKRYDDLFKNFADPAKISQADKTVIDIEEKLKVATNADTKARLENDLAVAKQAASLSDMSDAIEKENKSRRSTIEGVEKQTQSLEDEIATYGMSKAAIQDTIISRLEEEKVKAQAAGQAPSVIKGIDDEIAARQKLAGVMGQKDVLDANKRAAEETAKTWKEITDRVEQSLTDAIFDGGKSGADLLKNVFKALTVNIVIHPIMQGLQGQLQAAFGGSTNPDGSNQQSRSLFGGINGNSIVGSGLGSGISGLGSLFGSTTLSDFGVGAQLGAGSSTVALTQAQYANLMESGGAGSGALAAGKTAGSLPLGSILGYGGAILAASQGKYGSAIGTAIGTAIAPGVGTAIGGLVGSLVDGAFGGSGHTESKDELNYAPGSGLSAKFSDLGGATGPVGQITQKAVSAIDSTFAALGKDIRTGAVWAIAQAGSGDWGGTTFSGALTNSAGVKVGTGDFGLKDGMAGRRYGFGAGATDDSNVIANFTAEANQSVLQAFQSVADQFPKVIQQQLDALGDPNSLSADAAAAAVQSITTAVQQLVSLKNALNQLPLDNLHDLTLDATAALVQFAGGIDNLTQGVNAYHDAFFSDSEKQAQLVGQLSDQFKSLGIAMPDLSSGADAAKQQFRAIVESLDLTTASGQQTFAAMMSMASAFSQAATAAGQVGAAVQSIAQLFGAAQQTGQDALATLQKAIDAQKTSINAIAQAQQQAIQDSITAVSKSVSDLTSLTGKLQSALNSMAGQIDPAGTFTRAQARLDRALSVAKLTGQMPSGSDFDAALAAAQKPDPALFNSFEDFQAAQLRSANLISDLNAVSGTQLSIAQKQLDSLQDQLDQSKKWQAAEMQRLDGILASAQSQLNAALGIDDSVKDVSSALAAFTVALAAVGNLGYMNTNKDVAAAFDAGQFGGMTVDQAAQFHYVEYGQNEGRKAPANLSRGAEYMLNNPDVLNAFEKDSGGMTLEQYAKFHYDKYGQFEGRSYAVGTAYVPFDMTAQIHQGERIIPAADNRALMQMIGARSSDDAGLREEMRELRAENKEQRQMLQTLLSEIARSTKRGADGTDQMINNGVPVRADNPLRVAKVLDLTV